MEESYEVLKKAIDRVGVKALALKLKLSQALLYKWCQEPNDEASYDKSGAQNPLDRLRKVYEATEDKELIRWICQMADGYYVANPQVSDLKAEAKVFKNTQKMIQEFSETLNAIAQSYADKKITKKEAEHIRKEWEELKGIGEYFVRACEAGRYK